MILFTDVETTGFCPMKNDIISMAVVAVDNNLNKVGEFYQTVTCEKNEYYSEQAEEIHGFKYEEIATFQSKELFTNNLIEFLSPWKLTGKDTNKLYYHAIGNFDWRFILAHFCKLERHYDLYKFVTGNNNKSTIDLAKKVIDKKSFKYSLDNLCKHFDIELNHHNALSDCRATFELYKCLIKNDLLEE